MTSAKIIAIFSLIVAIGFFGYFLLALTINLTKGGWSDFRYWIEQKGVRIVLAMIFCVAIFMAGYLAI